MPVSRQPAPVALSETHHNRPFLVRRNPAARRYFDLQPPVPLLAVTRLQLDLLLSQPILDSKAISAVILSDVGATLQVMRVAAHRLRNSDGRAVRMEDWVVLLGRKALGSALWLTLPAQPARQGDAVRQFWRRARITAELSALLAKQFPKIDPATGYLAGLLCDVGRIPALLDWRVQGVHLADPDAVARALVREWRLPDFVESTLPDSAEMSSPSRPLAEIVSAARNSARAGRNGRWAPNRTLHSASGLESRAATLTEVPSSQLHLSDPYPIEPTTLADDAKEMPRQFVFLCD